MGVFDWGEKIMKTFHSFFFFCNILSICYARIKKLSAFQALLRINTIFKAFVCLPDTCCIFTVIRWCSLCRYKVDMTIKQKHVFFHMFFPL